MRSARLALLLAVSLSALGLTAFASMEIDRFDVAIVLEPSDESSIVLAATGSDVLSLEEIESDDSSADTTPGRPG